MSGDYKRLYRSRQDRMIAGVCGGLGEYLNVDPTIIRLLFVVLGFASVGTWLLIYFVMAIIIPERPLDDAPPASVEVTESEAEVSPTEENPTDESA